MEYVNPIIEKQLGTDVAVLKYKAIQNYMKLIWCLQKGKKISYQSILEIMSLIDIYSELDNKRIYYKEYYRNERFN